VSGITVTITGLDDVLAALDNVVPNVLERSMPEFEAAANNTLDVATEDCPYDAVHHKEGEPHLNETGRVEPIENGYNVTFGDDSGEYGYSWFVESGHRTRSGSHVPPQPYLEPAFDTSSDALLAQLEGILDV
jgi:hypothetical protein